MLLLLLLLPTALLVMLRVLERYERMIDAPPKRKRPAADVTTADEHTVLAAPRPVPAVEPVTELA